MTDCTSGGKELQCILTLLKFSTSDIRGLWFLCVSGTSSNFLIAPVRNPLPCIKPPIIGHVATMTWAAESLHRCISSAALAALQQQACWHGSETLRMTF